jgi:hypothetical protein
LIYFGLSYNDDGEFVGLPENFHAFPKRYAPTFTRDTDFSVA